MAERYPAVLEHVTFSYEGADRPVLDDVSLRINGGKKHGEWFKQTV